MKAWRRCCFINLMNNAKSPTNSVVVNTWGKRVSHLRAFEVRLKCTKSAAKVHQKCSKSAAKVQQKCSKSAAKVQQKCSKSAVTSWPKIA
jgi:ligand-binding sensor protein